MKQTAKLRYVEVRGERYLRLADVAAYVRELGDGEETDVRNRLNEAANQLLCSQKVKP
jgi:hypothetical protein